MEAIDLDYLAELCESDFIPKAERYFGPRNPNWTLGGIRRNPWGNHPQLLLFPDSGFVDILLSSQLDEGNLPSVLYELAHECVHLLDPHPVEKGTNLCEGLACWFQVNMSTDMRPTESVYVRALEAVERLMPDLRYAVYARRAHDSLPMHKIRFRHLEPHFLNVTTAINKDLRMLEIPFASSTGSLPS